MQGFVMQVITMCTQDLKTEVQKRFGLHQIHEAVEYYQANQTAGKVLLRADLTE
jgi:NADPH:quinone reductase-like Zn-dependent oxidoreductase